MVTKLKNITFVFENCDYITIDGKYVGDFLVDDIHHQIARLACNHIGRMDIADTFVIEIHKDANIERYELDQTHIESFKHMTFDRFKGNDITNIEFELEENYSEERLVPYKESYNYYVCWNADDEYENSYQSTYESDEGNFYIVISKDKTIEDFFDLKAINDKEYMDFVYEMYGLYEGTV